MCSAKIKSQSQNITCTIRRLESHFQMLTDTLSAGDVHINALRGS